MGLPVTVDNDIVAAINHLAMVVAVSGLSVVVALLAIWAATVLLYFQRRNRR
jgi:hypothetical protein